MGGDRMTTIKLIINTWFRAHECPIGPSYGQTVAASNRTPLEFRSGRPFLPTSPGLTVLAHMCVEFLQQKIQSPQSEHPPAAPQGLQEGQLFCTCIWPIGWNYSKTPVPTHRRRDVTHLFTVVNSSAWRLSEESKHTLKRLGPWAQALLGSCAHKFTNPGRVYDILAVFQKTWMPTQRLFFIFFFYSWLVFGWINLLSNKCVYSISINGLHTPVFNTMYWPL